MGLTSVACSLSQSDIPAQRYRVNTVLFVDLVLNPGVREIGVNFERSEHDLKPKCDSL